jgi:hypothetical protein
MNPDAMQEFLDKLHDAGDDAVILEDFRRINDISVLGTDLLVHAYQRVGGSFDSEQTAQSLAMRLFLDHPEAFEYAWSRYLFYRTTSKLASFPLEVPQLDVSEEQIGKFQGDLSKWLASQAKGKNCIINFYQDEDGSTLYVQRGAHLRTAPYWNDDKVEIISLRPASEDLLVYDQKRATLTIKAGLAKDREFYLGAFAYHVAGDGSLARKALDTSMFSLAPIEQGTFDYTGDGIITGVVLTRAKIRCDDIYSSRIDFRSADLLGAVDLGLLKLQLSRGKLVAVGFRFHIQPEVGRSTTVSFEIWPPVRSNLTQRGYANIIEDYLRDQGVMLR